jgi:two-component system phosphate regulon sensor histidine kinase PhoR
MTRAVEQLGGAKPARPLLPRVGGRLTRLARAINEASARLESRFEQLERDRQQLRAVLGGMAEGVIAVDSRRRLVFANDSAVRLFGLAPGSVGKLVAEIIRSPQVQRAVDATLDAGSQPFRGEIITPGPEAWPRGPGRCLDVQGTPLPGTPPPGAVLVFHDVTDLRRLERMRQDFVANASHELKTPLAAIKAYTETLVDWAIHDPLVNERFLKQIDFQADRLHRLVQDMLALARLESGNDGYHPELLALAEVVRHIFESHKNGASAKGLELSLDVEDLDREGTVEIVADDEAIRQILDNLIDNAIKYTPSGGRVSVACKTEDHQVRLMVADTGIGIPREDLPRVFERFYRVDRARSRELGGTGLGLSIVKHWVQALGGQIAVDSRVGAGTTFTISIPRPRVGEVGGGASRLNAESEELPAS